MTREKNARKEAEKLLEEKSLQLYALNKELEQFAEKLEQQVLERTQALEVATHKAEQANEAKSKFLANMSHELRTPLNGILGMISLTLKSTLNNEQNKYLTLAQSSVHSLLAVINDILDFSKIEAGKIALETHEFDIRTLVEEIALIHSKVAAEKNLELHCDTTELKGTLVIGDALRFRQIIDNLVNNAIKFTEQGEIQIILSSDIIAGHNHITCKIIDTGPGIPPDQQHLLFKSFTQLDGTTTRTHGGTGLGLSIAQRLCRLMQGKVSVSSEPGKGSQFSVTLSLPLPTDYRETDLLKPIASGKRALILALDNTDRAILRKILEKLGLNVTCSQDIADAVQILTQQPAQPPDFLFVDVGFKQSLKSLWPIPEQVRPVVVCPVASEVNTTDLGLPENYSSLEKPYSLNEVIACLCGALDRETGQNQQQITESRKTQFEHFTVLLVEDDIINQQVAKGLLDLIGAKSILAESGQLALDLLSQSGDKVDMILMDCQMPLMDGFETTERIRQGEAGEHCRNLPVIALTANVMENDKQMCLQAGMNAHLSKPIAYADLKATLKHWLLQAPSAKLASVSAVKPLTTDIDKGQFENLTKHLNTLQALLESYDTQSGALLEQIIRLVNEPRINNTLAHIKTLTNKYQYEDAAKLVANLRPELTALAKSAEGEL
ncbi:ATP-binding protein [Planctobacterium marinum]|uniref:ATP-binding protein n=1 Tax=Planctobacterium marinum TaxID=1631968 RepID=UPI001E36ECE5|nr:ATP-binding protein [Planctobacterium marinum]MCC2607600.1 response regulator [Planctobacterium marinum]